MSARSETYDVMARASARGIELSFDDANALRRAQITLHRWAELECGNGDEYKIWSIERDEKTDKPFMCVYPHTGNMRRYSIPDRERGALKRVSAICSRLGLHYYHQTDPRGCALYIAKEPIQDHNYSNAFACC